MKTKPIFFFLLPFAFTLSAFAGSATWSLNPTSSDWNTATNWTPNTIPDGPRAVATFDVSNQSSVVISGKGDQLDHISFTANASPYTITIGSGFNSKLTLSGAGIINISGIIQNFINIGDPVTSGAGLIFFQNSASAGDATTFTNISGLNNDAQSRIFFFNSSRAGTANFLNGGNNHTAFMEFLDNSTADNASFTNAGSSGAAGTGFILFLGNSSAGNGTFVNEGGFLDLGLGGSVSFGDSASAGTADFTLLRGGFRSNGGTVGFDVNSTADHATITAEGAEDGDVEMALVSFSGTASAGDALITLEGGLNREALGAQLTFDLNSTAGNSTLVAMNGPALESGARISFLSDSLGGTARLEILGPGAGSGLLVIDEHNSPGVSVGSIEGGGQVILGRNNLRVGTNNLSTTFLGTVVDGENGSGGSLSKTGTGTLTLSGANTYTGGTIVSQGALLVANTSGSATGTGAVNVTSGTLGGSGIISGALTIGGGASAVLAPAFASKKQVTLTLQSSVILQADATYTYSFKARDNEAQTDLLTANGVTINGAKIKLKGKTQGTLAPGLILTVINNTAAAAITGTFSNLADGAIVNMNGNNLQASYEGGDGNDLTLTVVP